MSISWDCDILACCSQGMDIDMPPMLHGNNALQFWTTSVLAFLPLVGNRVSNCRVIESIKNLQSPGCWATLLQIVPLMLCVAVLPYNVFSILKYYWACHLENGHQIGSTIQ